MGHPLFGEGQRGHPYKTFRIASESELSRENSLMRHGCARYRRGISKFPRYARDFTCGLRPKTGSTFDCGLAPFGRSAFAQDDKGVNFRQCHTSFDVGAAAISPAVSCHGDSTIT
jgi:hypothetical protein